MRVYEVASGLSGAPMLPLTAYCNRDLSKIESHLRAGRTNRPATPGELLGYLEQIAIIRVARARGLPI